MLCFQTTTKRKKIVMTDSDEDSFGAGGDARNDSGSDFNADSGDGDFGQKVMLLATGCPSI